MNKTIIIAEIGECFNGSLAVARQMINEAKRAGCDIAKFQTLDYENISEVDPEAEWFKRIALDPDKIGKLIRYAKEAVIEILFSPENVKTAQWLLDKGLKDVKIASSCMADRELVRFVNVCFPRVFISTGMASLGEVRSVVKRLNKVKDLNILHCVSEYPTGPLLEKRGLKALSHSNVRLNMMKTLVRLFPRHKVGYSDHTAGILAPVAAVAAGARIVEKHFTLDRETPIRNYRTGGKYLGTDHVLSIEPAELKEMVRQIRLTEEMMGGFKWERSDGEKILKSFLRDRFKNKV